MTRVFQSIVSSVLAAAVGLGAVLILGVLWWEVGRGLPGMVLGSFCGAVCAQQIRKRTTWPSSVLAASLGAGIASFLAIATGEAIGPLCTHTAAATRWYPLSRNRNSQSDAISSMPNFEPINASIRANFTRMFRAEILAKRCRSNLNG